MSQTTGEFALVDEEAYERNALAGSAWTGSRLAVGALTMLFGSFVFAYFYLRAVNNHDLWRIGNQHPPLFVGWAVLALLVVSAGTHAFAVRRLRGEGATLDWLVGTAIAMLFGVIGVGLQIWEMSRLPFAPGSSGYASVFVAFEPVFILVALGGLYWMETLFARALRVRWLLNPSPELAESLDVVAFRGSLDSFTWFWGFVAGVEAVFFVLFYYVR